MIIMAFAQPEALAQGFALLASLVTLMSAYSTWVTCVYLQLSHLLHYVVVKYSWRMPHGLGGRVEIGFACCFLFSDVDVSPSLLSIRGVMDGWGCPDVHPSSSFAKYPLIRFVWHNQQSFPSSQDPGRKN